MSPLTTENLRSLGEFHPLNSENQQGHPVGDANKGFDLKAAQQKLIGKSGKKYWRSLEEISGSPQFEQWMADEFPNRASLIDLNRRDLLKFMGASVALAGLAGCRSVFMAQDKVIPYVKAPEELVPGKPLYYATSVMLGAYATGVLVEQHEGRPIKLEGNVDHPASLGSIDSISQAELLNLYDPDRSSNVVQQDGLVSTWESFLEDYRKLLKAQKATGGAGIRIVTGSISSPTQISAIADFIKHYPSAQWVAHEAIGREAVIEGGNIAFGSRCEPIYDFTKAKVVVSLDADFLSPTGAPGNLKYARDFASQRRVMGYEGSMSRVYAFESSPGLVGAIADHRIATKASDVYGVAAALAAALGIPGYEASTSKEVGVAAKDLQQNSGASLVTVGAQQPAEVHALAYLINQTLGNIGKTISMIPEVAANTPYNLKSLTDDLHAGKVETILFVGGNPVFDAPTDLKFAEAVLKAKSRVRFGLYEDETSAVCQWQLPSTHSLEEWGDARAFDGSIGLIQPLIAPLHGGRSFIELMSALTGTPRSGYDMLREHYKGLGIDEKAWRVMLHDGILAASASKPINAVASIKSALTAPAKSAGIEVIFKPDPKIYDGRYANNGWLQELPNPMSKLTWDNVCQISPGMASSLGVKDDEVVELTYRGNSVKAAVLTVPGQPMNSVTIHLGYGRTRGGVVATVTGDDGGGFNAYVLRRSDAPFFDGGLEIKKVGGEFNLATTQGHQPLDGNHTETFKETKILGQVITEADDREVIVEFDLAEWLKGGKAHVRERDEKSKEIKDANLFPETIFEYTGPQWGMSIDMNTCVGCNACVTACQAENNIPVVGKIQVGRHREMHWIRLDRYYSGDTENPQVAWQPVMCMHCEKAPCEPVCPVAATVHSHEGLNQMVYNRCVGTRYCSNNCPYKVRRFNYLNYTDNQRQFDVRIDDSKTNQRIPLLKLMNNPDVTVRGRGIMEKCTYCVQRINEARIEAKKANREIKDGEVVTACQQACPTQAIVFGNIADPNSAVHKTQADPRGYKLLEELQTRPRTVHLAKLRNPHPELVPAHEGANG